MLDTRTRHGQEGSQDELRQLRLPISCQSLVNNRRDNRPILEDDQAFILCSTQRFQLIQPVHGFGHSGHHHEDSRIATRKLLRKGVWLIVYVSIVDARIKHKIPKSLDQPIRLSTLRNMCGVAKFFGSLFGQSLGYKLY